MSGVDEALRELLVGLPSLRTLAEAQIAVWPDHERYLASRFAADDAAALARTNDVAALVAKIIGRDLEIYCEDYRWMCDNFNVEQYHFAKTGRYRLSTFAEAYDQVYDRPEYMCRYVRGILLSQIFWRNHAQAVDYLRTAFLPGNPPGSRHLEVGPGHGLLLYFAATDERTADASGWDVSKSSLTESRKCLEMVGMADRVRLIERDILSTSRRSDDRFDSIVISEVLEHLEQPARALATLRDVLTNKGRILINVPINSPAPDHIYLWTSFDAVNETIRSVGLRATDAQYYPVTGNTIEQALKRRLAISCLVTCTRE